LKEIFGLEEQENYFLEVLMSTEIVEKRIKETGLFGIIWKLRMFLNQASSFKLPEEICM
jgi:hypothetical protein